MKSSLFLILLLFFSVNFNSSGQISDSKLQKDQLKNEVLANLTHNILPFWSDRMVDNKKGGFYGRIDSNNKVYPGEDKGGILNARILWTYSSAYRILKDTAYLQLATRTKEYIMAHFIDKQYGGAYRSVKSNGAPSDTRKQIYTQSFFIYGLCEYYRATGDTESLNCAKQIFELFEKYALDTQNGGYFEVFTRDWHRSHDLIIGEKSVNDEKTMNTHLHIMEAYTNLYKVWPEKRVGDELKNLVILFLDKIIDAKTFHLICFMDKNWNRTSDIDSYGHDIESSWLLNEAADLLDDSILSGRVKLMSIKVADAALEGLQADGSMIYEKDLSSNLTNNERSWWVQAETVVGCFNVFEMTGDERYLEKSLNCWKYTKNHIVDNKAGGWFSSVSESGVPGHGDKGGFWVCPYHNSRMCMEIYQRVTEP
ncbi:MAG TPA: AGE family epimerase/isomerase [Bacteroidales bacterium]|nr:AGE family epimerase/isomerase [Bacteroidales bacterium]